MIFEILPKIIKNKLQIQFSFKLAIQVVVCFLHGKQCAMIEKILAKTTNFCRRTKTSSPTPYSRASPIPPIRYKCILIDTSSNKIGAFVSVTLERGYKLVKLHCFTLDF